MDKITLSDLPRTLETIYRAGISLCFLETRDPGSAIAQTHALQNAFSIFVAGAGRPFSASGPMPAGFNGIGEWGDIAPLGRIGYPNPTIGLITGYPLDDAQNTSLYADILSAFMEPCEAPLLLVMAAASVPHAYARLAPTVRVLPPNQPEREQILVGIAEKNGYDTKDVPDVARALSGLDPGEIRQIGLLQLLTLGQFDANQAALEKSRRLVQGGFLEPIAPSDIPIGGLGGLKRWLESRANALKQKGLPMPQGIVLVGPPGSGKSLSAKLVQRTFALPLIRLDAGRLMGSYVGESEKNMRTALSQVEGLSPCIMWIDEIEKGMAGSNANGSEITRRMLQTLLSWMQEQRGAFVFATANDISSLPPELLRKGRFDEIFYVDLPTEPERREIWEGVLRSQTLDPNHYDIEKLTKETETWTGAEIAAALTDALYESPDTPSQADLEHAVRSTKPLSVLAPEQIDAIRRWGATHARPASGPVISTAQTQRLQG